jgi:hypothetical protein
MGGDDVPVSLPHIRFETLISLDKGPLYKFWPFYGVYILSSHAVALLPLSNLDPSQKGVVIGAIHIINTLISASPAFGCPEKQVIHHAFWE